MLQAEGGEKWYASERSFAEEVGWPFGGACLFVFVVTPLLVLEVASEYSRYLQLSADLAVWAPHLAAVVEGRCVVAALSLWAPAVASGCRA